MTLLGNIYFADEKNNCIRKITVATGIITTIAGNGTKGYNGDNVAISSLLYYPHGITIDSLGKRISNQV